MTSKETVQAMIDYLKANRQDTLKNNLKKFGISVQTYHNICKKHGLDGKIGPMRKSCEASVKKVLQALEKINTPVIKAEVSDTEEYSSDQGNSE